MNGSIEHVETHLSTLSLHGDDDFLHLIGDKAVAPALSVSTTFRYPKPTEADVRCLDETIDPYGAEIDIYSRYTRPTTTRVEKVLGKILKGHAMVFPSGLAAAYAALLHVQPTVVAITGGYYGVHATIRQYAALKGDVKMIGLDDEFPPGTLCWVETPVNPTGEERDLSHYAAKVHAVGGQLIVDATFGPPPLQDPFAWGVDIVMHSATKYLAGHSDCLMGVLAVQSKEEWSKLWKQRTYTGATPGSMESWLLLRSLRTLEVRVRQQAQTGTALAHWLHELANNAPRIGETFDGAPGGVVSKVWHATLQKSKPARQQLSDGPACFAIMTQEADQAKWLMSAVKLFTNATSLGGVESLIEQRFIADGVSDKRIVRLSVGLEHLDDLKDDLRIAFKEVLKVRIPDAAHCFEKPEWSTEDQ